MENIKIALKNCYGIQALEHEFDFVSGAPKNKAFAIYAPNGLMKTSFTKTFERLSQGKLPEEERFNRFASADIKINDITIAAEEIYVLKSEIDLQEETSAITDILVNPEHKSRYDAILVDLDKQKIKLINTLQKISGVPKKDIEKSVIDDVGTHDFALCISTLLERSVTNDDVDLPYSIIFDPKTADFLKSAEFSSGAKEFNARYQELFTQEGTIYQKGIFNPARADNSFNTLDKQGFFNAGHRLQMRGDSASIDKDELATRLKKIHARIDEDETLKKLRANLAKNAQTQALSDLFENLDSTKVDGLLEKLRPENQSDFRLDLWAAYLQNNTDAAGYVTLFKDTKDEIERIESEAAQATPRWTAAVSLFNNRFVDMPFSLSIENQTQAALGKERAKLRFIFKDGVDTVNWSRSEVKTLSQGEKRAMYLLNFIFEVEARVLAQRKTLFIIDDVADSFDYKNKHAIVQYLEDLNEKQNLYQIILTHNFDFFRTLAGSFVHRERCLMANRHPQGIKLSKAEGIKNYFTGILKQKVSTNPRALCATIPFTRNILEYTKGDNDPDYIKLTSLLHWKEDTDSITDNDYLSIYNTLFSTTHTGNEKSIKVILFEEAQAISTQEIHAGLDLEDKVLLSMAIRICAEEFLINRIRKLINDYTYWCASNNQFGNLMKELKRITPNADEIAILEKVSITVSSNIHLNSFMYEPILDLTIDHLILLYIEIKALRA
ncbi:hypothetical protein AKG95_20515 [Janthinobacterium lividum]|uniref:Protein CR006 P-loop domain-containing protein n=1 Tax=Janthinobacterium lividum TaxID=29581 RepID=A0A1S1U4Y9_9BURK|nr:hypothetical protein [Janthinobacterium lividum]OHV95527.1 hypothetical protein AKG95_20515 [Janthinobacterium lividum]